MNNSRRQIEIGVEIGDSCRTMRGVTVTETATTVTVGAYVTDTTLPGYPGDTQSVSCFLFSQVGNGMVALNKPLGSRKLLHEPVTEH